MKSQGTLIRWDSIMANSVTNTWITCRLGEVCDVKDGTHQTPSYVASGVPFYSVETLTNDDFTHVKFISEEEYAFLTKSFRIEKGDVLMTRIGSIGQCKYVDWNPRAAFYVSLALLKFRDDSIARFIAHYSNTSEFKEEINNHSLIYAIPQKINLGSISEISVRFPASQKERDKISDYLDSIDNLIITLNSKIQKKKAIKQGAMQQLLTGKKRLLGFTEPCEEKPLKDLGFMTAGGTPSTFVSEYWGGEINWLQSGAVKNKVIQPSAVERKITKAGLEHSAAYMIRKDSVLIAITGATCGNIGYLPFASSANQSVVSIETNENTDAMFLYQLLLTYRNNIIALRSGSAQGGVSLGTLSKLKVRLPSIKKEQTAIAETLYSFDKEIDALNTKLGKYKQLKTAMMQQLLTGKIRLI